MVVTPLDLRVSFSPSPLKNESINQYWDSLLEDNDFQHGLDIPVRLRMVVQNLSDALDQDAVVEASSVASLSGDTFESVMRDASARPVVVGNADTSQLVRTAVIDEIPNEENTTIDDSDSNKLSFAYEANFDHEDPIKSGPRTAISDYHGSLLQNGRFSIVANEWDADAQGALSIGEDPGEEPVAEKIGLEVDAETTHVDDAIALAIEFVVLEEDAGDEEKEDHDQSSGQNKRSHTVMENQHEWCTKKARWVAKVEGWSFIDPLWIV